MRRPAFDFEARLDASVTGVPGLMEDLAPGYALRLARHDLRLAGDVAEEPTASPDDALAYQPFAVALVDALARHGQVAYNAATGRFTPSHGPTLHATSSWIRYAALMTKDGEA